MKIELTITSSYRISLKKHLADLYGIKIGDRFEFEVINGKIILTPIDKVLLHPETLPEIEPNKAEVLQKRAKIVRAKVEKNKPVDLDTVICIDNNSKYVSNLVEGKDFKKKYYSECGLLVRTKTKYIDNYCKICQGRLANNYMGKFKCKYLDNPELDLIKEEIDDRQAVEISDADSEIEESNFEIEESGPNLLNENLVSVNHTDNEVENTEDNDEEIADTISETEDVRKGDSPKIQLKDVICKDDLETARLNNKFVIENINQKVTELIGKLQEQENINQKSIHKQKVNNIKKDEDELDLTDFKTSIFPVSFNHMRSCKLCEKYSFSGFKVNDKYFMCRDCVQKDFNKYLDNIKEEIKRCSIQ